MAHRVLLALALWTFGCNGDNETHVAEVGKRNPNLRNVSGHAAPAAPFSLTQPVVWMEPGDLMTAVGDSPLRVVVDNHRRSVDSAVLADIASRVSLTTYPGNIVVPVDLKVNNVRPGVPRAIVDIVPRAKLTSSWHAIRLAPVPTGVAQTGAFSNGTRLSDGTLIARFHPGSQPVLKSISTCVKSGVQGLVVYLYFSERVKTKPGTPVTNVATVEQAGAQLGCAPADPGIPSEGLGHVVLLCPNLVGGQKATVTLQKDISALEGTPLGGAGEPAPLSHEFTPNPSADLCTEVHPLAPGKDADLK